MSTLQSCPVSVQQTTGCEVCILYSSLWHCRPGLGGMPIACPASIGCSLCFDNTFHVYVKNSKIV